MLNRRTTLLALATWGVTHRASVAVAAGPDASVSSDNSPTATTTRQGVTGRVTSASGAPIANVFVQARALEARRPVPDLAVMTDQTGQYAWNLGAGRYELTFMQDGRELQRRSVVVRDNELTRLDVQVAAAR